MPSENIMFAESDTSRDSRIEYYLKGIDPV